MAIIPIIQLLVCISVTAMIIRRAKRGSGRQDGRHEDVRRERAPRRPGRTSGLLRAMDGAGEDWLAQQRRQERRSMEQMYAQEGGLLRDEHHSSCDAELLRSFHRDDCEAYAIQQDYRREPEPAEEPQPRRSTGKMTKAEIEAKKAEIMRRRAQNQRQ